MVLVKTRNFFVLFSALWWGVLWYKGHLVAQLNWKKIAAFLVVQSLAKHSLAFDSLGCRSWGGQLGQLELASWYYWSPSKSILQFICNDIDLFTQYLRIHAPQWFNISQNLYININDNGWLLPFLIIKKYLLKIVRILKDIFFSACSYKK